MHEKTLAELAAGLRVGEYSSVELTRHYLDRIAQYDARLNSFITVTAEQALADAVAADERLAQGETGLLTGIPIAYKDIFCTEGVKTSCGSYMLDNFIAPYDATVVSNLRDAGVVMLGKTNMDEFAMGSTNESSHYGPVLNPWDTDCVPGGSSGGSATAVAARLSAAAIGTDTGGSVRQPAALTGLTGLKPTYGRCSRWGMVAYASSLDQAGPLAQTAEDIAIVLGGMAGFDAKDSTSVDHPVDDYRSGLEADLKGLKIGLPKEYFGNGLDAEVAEAVLQSVRVYESMGAEIVDISLRYNQPAVSAYYVVALAEASSNLSRYDGVRFGHRCENPQDLADLYKRSRSEGFGAEVKRRIMLGCYTLSAGYYDAYYLKAQKIRRLIADDFRRVLQEVDLIVGPVTPYSRLPIGQMMDDPIRMYLGDIYTVTANLSGLPAISYPVGRSQAGMPIGAQMIGDYWREGQLLSVAHQYQQQTHWRQMPTMFAA